MRLGTYDFTPTVNAESTELMLTNNEVAYPGIVAVQVAFNGQQYTSERVVHKRDPAATFKYYQDPIITFHNPMSGPSVGGTRIKIYGYGFAPNEGKRDSSKNTGNYLWVRYMDVNDETKVLAGPYLIDEDKYDNMMINLISPA